MQSVMLYQAISELRRESAILCSCTTADDVAGEGIITSFTDNSSALLAYAERGL